MPPARPRAMDDSRSETSSTVTNLKEKAVLTAATGAGISKTKRAQPNILNGMSRPTTNGTAAAMTVGSADTDPGLPRMDWANLPPSILHTYRTTYRLPTPSSYTHFHADLIYNSSPIALRAPSAVQSRRRLCEFKHQRRKNQDQQPNGTKPNKTKTKEKDLSADLLKLPTQTQGKEKEKDPAFLCLPSTNPPEPLLSIESLGKQSPATLAVAVRKHFNAQQLNEAETVARFIYVAHQGVQRGTVPVEGSAGDGSGWAMGTHGREVRRGEGGEVGFRLRFRPG